MEGGLSTGSQVSWEDAEREIWLNQTAVHPEAKKKDKFKLNSSKSKWKSRQVFETRGNKWPLRIGVLFASWWCHFPGRWRVPKDTVGLLIRVLLELCEAGEVQVLFFMPKRVDASTELCPAAVPGPQWWCRKLQTMGSSSGNVAEEEFL